MSSDSSNLFSLARSKLHLSVGSKDSCNLHRWVLLKNSIIHSPTLTSTVAVTNSTQVCSREDGDDDDEEDDPEVSGSVEVDSFMFPDAGKFVNVQAADVKASEAQWLDSLLETLGDDDEDDFPVESDIHISAVTPEDDEDHFLSPLGSPMSSSDDLHNQPAYYSSSNPVSYPIPYPIFHPPLLHSYHFDLPAPYEDPLPYYASNDDSEDLSVPDAIEDTSDDESEAPPTPSFGRSSSSLSLEAASVPLPVEHSRLRQSHPPHVYVNSGDEYFYPFDIDGLPFPAIHHLAHNPYQDC